MKRRFLGFSIIGGLVFLLGAAVLSAGVEIAHLQILQAYALQAIVSIEASFFLNRRLNWSDRGPALLRPWLRFHAAKIVTVIADQILFVALIGVGAHYMAANIATTAALTICNFALNDRFVFRGRRATAPSGQRHNHDFSIILPTYDEPGIAGLLAEITATVNDARYEVLVIDDSPNDDTALAVQTFALGNPAVRLIRGPRKGLGVAMLFGARQSRGSFLVYMDADGQHPVGLLPTLIEKARAGYDMVLPSRYIAGGDCGGLDGIVRCMVSRSLRLLPRVLFPRRLGAVTDALGGFFGVRRAALDFERMRPSGWKFGLEVLLFSQIERQIEVPYAFGKRVAGVTKANWKIGAQYLGHLASLVRRYYFAPAAGAAARQPGGAQRVAGAAALPRVGVVIPARSSEAVIRTCVEDLLAQDYRGEFFIVVAGSPNDSTFDPIRDLISDGRVIALEVAHHNPAVRDSNLKRLRGRELATRLGAQLIFFTDTKIRFGRDLLRRAVDLKHANGVDAVAGTMAAWPEQRRSYWARVLDHGLISEMPRFGKRRILTQATYGSSPSMPITACFLVDNAAFDSMDQHWSLAESRYCSHEDSRIAMELVATGRSILATDRLLVFHKHRTDTAAITLKWRRAGYSIGAMLRDEPANAFLQMRARKAALVGGAWLGALLATATMGLAFGLAGLAWVVWALAGAMFAAGIVNSLRALSPRMLLVPWGTALLVTIWVIACAQGYFGSEQHNAPERMLQIH